MTSSQTFRSRIRQHTVLCPATLEDDNARIMFVAIALAGETGELMNLLKKEWRDGTNSDRAMKIAEEMGDIYNYLHMLANLIGVNLEYEAERKLLEFERRPENAALFKK